MGGAVILKNFKLMKILGIKVRLIDVDGSQIGIVPIRKALEIAAEKG